MRLRAILFDFWGTLIHDLPERSRPRQAWRAGRVQSALDAHNCFVDPERITAVLADEARALAALQDKGTDLMAGGRAELFSQMLRDAGGPAVPASALAEVEEAIGEMPEAYQPVEAPMAVQTLAVIKSAGLATALVSNTGLTTSSHLRRLLRDLDMLPYLDQLVFSDEIGVAKPDLRIFSLALSAIGMDPGECAFVGDSPHNDIGGAKGAGLFTIQIGSRQMDGVLPDVRIEFLGELLPALQLHEPIGG